MSEAKQEHSVLRSPPRRKFTAEFKQQAVRLVTDEKYTFKAAAEALNVGEQSLRQWHAKLAPAPTPCGEHATLDELRAENQRLQRELRRAEMEREILKKPRRISRRSRCEIRLDPRTTRHVPHLAAVPSA